MDMSKELAKILEAIQRQLGQDQKPAPLQGSCGEKSESVFMHKLSFADILVILGLLTGALEVQSLTVDKEQQVEISLGGSLRRKNELDRMMDKIGTMPFDEVWKALMRR